MPIGGLWDRLKNNLAFRVGTLYAGGSWFVVEALDTLGLEPAVVRRTALLLALGFLVVVPVALLLDRRARKRAEAEASGALSGTHATPPAGGTARSGRAGVRRWTTAVVVLCGVAAGLWAIGARASGDKVPKAATSLVVLPFHATGGDDVREYGIGMVNLLSAALDGVGGIRTVPSQTVLARVGEGSAVRELPEYLRLGAALGAGSVLMGTVTAVGSQVSLTASIRETGTGNELATAEIRGDVGRILELTDELAVKLLRDLWRSNAPLPTVNVASLTTSSPAALSAYLRGESALRRIRSDSAVLFFQRATQLDSTFALAWLRLASAAAWTGDEELSRRREWAGRALSLIDRLPERETSLVRAYNLFLNGSLAALDTLDRYVARYPDDPQGLYELGYARFYAAWLGRYTSEQITEPLLQASRLDPSLALGLVHVLSITLAQGDSAGFNAALRSFEQVAAAERVASYRARARVRWAPTDSLLAVFASELEPLAAGRDRGRIVALANALGNQVRLESDVDPAVYIGGMDTILRRFGNDPFFSGWARLRRVEHFGTLGMADSAEVELDRFLVIRPDFLPLPPATMRAMARLRLALDGAVPYERVVDDVALIESRLSDAVFFPSMVSEYYNLVGDHRRAGQLAPPAGEVMPPNVVDTVGVQMNLAGWMRIMRGDTVGGLREFEAGLQRIAATGGANVPWLAYGEVLATMPSRREQAIRILRWRTQHSAINTGQAFLSVARALELNGDLTDARVAYEHVVRLWHHADAHRRPGLDEATAALVRLRTDRPH